ncbi:MAG: hypothetical protein ACH37Z_19320 [Anaerolineae bacterium]|nr:hypothetical protein [Acidobacteriota bacterium]
MTSYLNEVSKALGETVNQTRDQLRQMQPAPLGREPDSGHKQAALWKKLRTLDREHFNSFLDTAAQKVGHQNDEEKPCSVCAFVMKHASKERDAVPS